MAKQALAIDRLKINFNWKIALGVLFLFSVLMRLGFWQLDRAAQKRQIQSNRNALSRAKPITIAALELDNIKALNFTKVVLHGSYDNEKSILLLQRMFKGVLGVELITAFKLQAGDKIVLVSRGWAPVEQNGQQLPLVDPIKGQQKLVGEIYVAAGNTFFLPQKIERPPHWPLRLYHFDLTTIAPLFKQTVLPFVVRLDDNNAGVLTRYWAKRNLQAETSTSYAMQWFAMAGLLLVIALAKSSNIFAWANAKLH